MLMIFHRSIVLQRIEVEDLIFRPQNHRLVQF